MSGVSDDEADDVSEATGGHEPIGLRQRKKAKTLDAIVTAALDLFERKGYDATTIEEIAEAADVSPRTFFRYFDSKQDLMKPPRDEEPPFDRMLATRPPEEGPVEAMRHVMVSTLGAVLVEDPSIARRMRVMLSTPSLRAIARDNFNEHEADFARTFAVRLGVAEDDLRPHVIASVVGNLMWTVINRWVDEGGEPDKLLPMIDEGFALLAKGLD